VSTFRAVKFSASEHALTLRLQNPVKRPHSYAGVRFRIRGWQSSEMVRRYAHFTAAHQNWGQAPLRSRGVPEGRACSL